MDPSKSETDWQESFYVQGQGNLITTDTTIVTSPDGKGVILVGVGDDNNQPTTTLVEWQPNGLSQWIPRTMNQTLKFARKGSIVVPVSDKWTSCNSKYLTHLQTQEDFLFYISCHFEILPK